MVLGAVDPLEGAVLILLGSAAAALGAGIAHARGRRLLYWAFALMSTGCGAMLLLSVYGGIGQNAPYFRSLWWGLFMIPYPVGWLMGIIAVIRVAADMSEGIAPARKARPMA